MLRHAGPPQDGPSAPPGGRLEAEEAPLVLSLFHQDVEIGACILPGGHCQLTCFAPQLRLQFQLQFVRLS